MMKKEIKFSLVYRDMWQSSGKYQPRVDQLVRIAPLIIEMGCFARVETNGGAFEQVNLLYGENPNKAVRAFTAPFKEAGIQTHMLDRGLNALRMYPVPADVRKLMYKVKHAQGVDITRIFCGLNETRNIIPSIKYALEAGMIPQATLCITYSPVHTVEYYARIADQLIEAGAPEICLKDMAGIGRPGMLGELVRTIKEKHPDILIQYHGHSGPGLSMASILEVCENGADPEMAEIPIIFLTALNSTADIVKGFQVGGNDFISKPFNKEELIIRVTHQISLVAAKRIIVAQTEELRKTIMGRDKLYSVIAHDLRSPMGSIKMVLNMLILNLPSDTIGDEMYELLTMANQTTEDVFSLLDNLLKWTKSQIGKLKVVYQDINMVEVVEGVSEIFTMVASLKNIKIVQDVPVENVAVRADIDMIKTVIRNLISNAIKFSNEGSEVVVSLTEEDGMAIVSVKDSGCGIDDENQKKLLHTDTHFSTFGTNNEEGSGLGLLLCQDFVVKNGGKLWFTSKKGDGSTFSFSIPLLEK